MVTFRSRWARFSGVTCGLLLLLSVLQWAPRARFDIIQFPFSAGSCGTSGNVRVAVLPADGTSGPGAAPISLPATGVYAAACGAGCSLGGHLEFLGQRQRLRLAVGICLLTQLSINQILLNKFSILQNFEFRY